MDQSEARNRKIFTETLYSATTRKVPYPSGESKIRNRFRNEHFHLESGIIPSLFRPQEVLVPSGREAPSSAVPVTNWDEGRPGTTLSVPKNPEDNFEPNKNRP